MAQYTYDPTQGKVVPVSEARVVTYITDNPAGMPAMALTDYNATSTAGDELGKKQAAAKAVPLKERLDAIANELKAAEAAYAAAVENQESNTIVNKAKARVNEARKAYELSAPQRSDITATPTPTPTPASTKVTVTPTPTPIPTPAPTPTPSIFTPGMTPEEIADAATKAAAEAETAATTAAADVTKSTATATAIAASAEAGAADAATAASTAATNSQKAAEAAQASADALQAAADAVKGLAGADAAQEEADAAQEEADAAQEAADEAAAEADATAESNAAAADLKAKQEADAKAAADKAAAELKAKQDAEAKAAADKLAADKVTTQQRESIITILTDRFNKFGLGSLAGKIRDLAIDGASEATITIGLQETEEYKVRFSANTDRLNKGLKVLTPGEYLNLEDGYRQILRSYGLKQFDTDAYVKQFISNDVSAAELSDRVVTAVQRVQNADPAISQTLRDFYGIGNADMVAYVLDPNQQLQKIQRQVAAAEVGTAARRQGLEAGVQVSEQLAAQGVSQAEAQKGYATIANILPTAEKLSEIYGGTMQKYGQAEGEQEVFNSLASAQRAREKLSAREIAQFQGSSGTMKTSLSSATKGQL